jgi:hypothetical protein
MILAPAVVAAQSPRTRGTVHVIDTAAAALSGVDVSVVRDLATTLAHATTGSAGRAVVVSRTTAPLQVVARRIGYLPGYQFFTLSDATDSLTLEMRPDMPQRRARGLELDSLARYRFRLLGAYDAATGDPIVDLAVTDSTTGVSARTTSTGTVSLFFLPEGTSMVRLRHAGYRDTTITVMISPRDTLPITLLLAPRG